MQAEANQAGAGEDDGIEVAAAQFVEAGLHVAAQVQQFEVGTQAGELHAAAQAACADARAWWQFGEAGVVVTDEGVMRVFARQDGSDAEAFRQVHANVFHGVNGNVGFSARHRLFQLFDEESFAADAGKRCVEDLVAPGGHRHEADGKVRIVRAQASGNMFGLPQREFAFAGGDTDLRL